MARFSAIGNSKEQLLDPYRTRGSTLTTSAQHYCWYAKEVLGKTRRKCFDWLRLLRLDAMIRRGKSVPEALLTQILPTPSEAKQAEETSRLLSSRLRSKTPLRLRVVGAPDDETVVLPASALKMLVGILDEMGRGNTVTVIPVHAELTTQEAADMLSISRPSLIQMLDEGKIEYRKVGTHRRVRFESVMAYKRKVHAERLAALNELAAYDQEIGI
jgi:excisionase family DNA binding protein